MRREACQWVQFIRYLGGYQVSAVSKATLGAREIPRKNSDDALKDVHLKRSARRGQVAASSISIPAGLHTRLLNRRVQPNDDRTRWTDCDNLRLLQVVDEN